MVRYREYTDESGTERVIAYSDKSMMIERDGQVYSEADDFAYQERTYTETDIPIDDTEPKPEPEPEPTGDLTVADTLQMLNQMGVDISDQ